MALASRVNAAARGRVMSRRKAQEDCSFLLTCRLCSSAEGASSPRRAETSACVANGPAGCWLAAEGKARPKGRRVPSPFGVIKRDQTLSGRRQGHAWGIVIGRGTKYWLSLGVHSALPCATQLLGALLAIVSCSAPAQARRRRRRRRRNGWQRTRGPPLQVVPVDRERRALAANGRGPETSEVCDATSAATRVRHTSNACPARCDVCQTPARVCTLLDGRPERCAAGRNNNTRRRLAQTLRP